MAQLRCLRCGAEMRFAGQEKIQLGKTGWLSGDLPNLLAGALAVSIMECPHCGKLEFFSGRADVDGYGGSELPQRTCPKCVHILQVELHHFELSKNNRLVHIPK